MRRGLKAFGLSVLAALSLMAFTAGGAQAQEFLTSAGTFKSLGITSEGITGTQIGTGLLRILGLELLLKCEKAAVSESSVSVLGHGQAAIKFSTCYVTDKSLKKAACVVTEPIEAKVLALIILHGAGNHAYILFEPQTVGGNFATVKVHGAFCTLPLEAAVTGSTVAEILNSLTHQAKPRFAVTEGTLTLFPNHKLFYGIREGHLQTEAEVWFSGAREGQSWGAL